MNEFTWNENRQSRARRCLEVFGKAAETKGKWDTEDLLDDIHRAILLLARKDDEIRLDEGEALGRAFRELAETYEDPIPGLGRFGHAFAVLRAGEFESAAESFREMIATGGGLPAALRLSVLCFGAIAESLARQMGAAGGHLEESAALADTMAGRDGACPARGLAAVAETLHLYKAGEHERALQCWREQSQAFWSAGHDLHSRFPYFEAQGLMSYAKTLRETGLYGEALETLTRERTLREVMGDRLGEVWGRLEEARLHHFRHDYDKAESALELAVTFLRNCQLNDLLARVEDKRGDIHRARGNQPEAQRSYRRAENLAKASGCPLLKGHVANSIARLLQDEEKPDDAVQTLAPHAATWEGTKEYGKFLYLSGQTEAQRLNFSLAEDLYEKALAELRRFGMRSYEALTLNRLAQLRLRRNEEGDRKAACQNWSEALRIAGRVQAEKFLHYIKEAVNQLEAADLVPIVEEVLKERAADREKVVALESARRRVGARRFAESHSIGHWVVEPAWAYLQKTDPESKAVPRVVREFFRLMRTVQWGRWMDGKENPPGMSAAEVRIAIAESASMASKELGLADPIEVTVDEEITGAIIDAAVLRELIRAIFRALISAFGVKRIRVRPYTAEGRRGNGWRLVPEGMTHEEMAIAPDLVPLDLAVHEDGTRAYFDRGYTGDFTLADFLAELVVKGSLLWEEVEPGIPSLVIGKLESFDVEK